MTSYDAQTLPCAETLPRAALLLAEQKLEPKIHADKEQLSNPKSDASLSPPHISEEKKLEIDGLSSL